MGVGMNDFKEPESISSLVGDLEHEQKVNSELKDEKKHTLGTFQVDGKMLLTMNVKALVDKPDDVHVEVNQGEQTTVFEVKVHKSDLGKVIGKHGETAKALRRILFGFAVKCKMRAVMEIIE